MSTKDNGPSTFYQRLKANTRPQQVTRSADRKSLEIHGHGHKPPAERQSSSFKSDSSGMREPPHSDATMASGGSSGCASNRGLSDVDKHFPRQKAGSRGNGKVVNSGPRQLRPAASIPSRSAGTGDNYLSSNVNHTNKTCSSCGETLEGGESIGVIYRLRRGRCLQCSTSGTISQGRPTER